MNEPRKLTEAELQAGVYAHGEFTEAQAQRVHRGMVPGYSIVDETHEWTELGRLSSARFYSGDEPVELKNPGPQEFSFTMQGGQPDPTRQRLLYGATWEQLELLRRLNLRWQQHVDPGVPEDARRHLGGPPENRDHYTPATITTKNGRQVRGWITSGPRQGAKAGTHEFDFVPRNPKDLLP